MQLLFLGTGPAESLPRKGHKDELCRDARRGGKSRRQRSAALVTSGQTVILIDAGPDIRHQLRQAKPKRIDAVLLTHGHEDAIAGLKDLDNWLSNPPRTLRTPRTFRTTRTLSTLSPPVPLFTDPLTSQRLLARFGAFKRLSFVDLKDYTSFKIGDTRIMPLPVLHTRDNKFKTYGYRFESFCYASDFFGLPQRTKSLLKGLDTLILDAAMYLGVKMPTHMSADATLRLAAELKVRRVFLTQTGHTYPPHDQAEKAIQAYARSWDRSWPKIVRLAYDGLKVKV